MLLHQNNKQIVDTHLLNLVFVETITFT